MSEISVEQRREIIRSAVATMINGLGLSTDDPQLTDTPDRVARAWVDELACGLFEPEPYLTTFPNHGYDEMVVLGPIEVKSVCSHHLLPFYGNAWVGYIPGERLVGLSKLARIVRWYSRRPQVQEALTSQIANHLTQRLDPLGVGVYVRATHTCMILRGVNESPSATMATSAMRGAFFERPEARQEFFDIVHNGGGQ